MDNLRFGYFDVMLRRLIPHRPREELRLWDFEFEVFPGLCVPLVTRF